MHQIPSWPDGTRPGTPLRSRLFLKPKAYHSESGWNEMPPSLHLKTWNMATFPFWCRRLLILILFLWLPAAAIYCVSSVFTSCCTKWALHVMKELLLLLGTIRPHHHPYEINWIESSVLLVISRLCIYTFCYSCLFTSYTFDMPWGYLHSLYSYCMNHSFLFINNPNVNFVFFLSDY